jgi:hypothetical protein
MNKFFSVLALVALSCAGIGCAANPCDALCDRTDECLGTDVADTCKEGYASATSAQQEACQTALDVYDTAGACLAGDDDDSSN